MKGMLRIGLVVGSMLALLPGLIVLCEMEAGAEENPRVAVLPFFMERPKGLEKGVVCPFCKGIYRGGEILPGAQNTLMRLLHQKIEGLRDFRPLPMEKVEEAFLKFDRRGLRENPLSSSLGKGRGGFFKVRSERIKRKSSLLFPSDWKGVRGRLHFYRIPLSF